jgi:hypothetical protein
MNAGRPNGQVKDIKSFLMQVGYQEYNLVVQEHL